MKNCLTCGATVADDASVCPDCGMELDAAPPNPYQIPATPPAPALAVVDNAPSEGGFTVEFGSPAAPAEVAAAPAPIDLAQPDSVPPTPATPAPATATITLKRGGALTDDKFVVSGGAIVGRFDPESGPVDVDLAPLPESSYVSRHHVEFRYDAGNDTWLVKDMGSRNGTFWRAGGQGAFARITAEQLLSSGDEISLGNARFEFAIQ